MANRRDFNLLVATTALFGPVVLARTAVAADLMCGVEGSTANSLTKSQVEAWLAAYGTAWVEKDSAKVLALFTPDGHYHDNAFEPVMVGHDAIRTYWETVTADQKDIKFESTVWSLSDTTAMVHWKAEFTSQSQNKLARLDGIFRLTFQPPTSGQLQCSELLEWWFFNMA
jgi:ketosteroid isomerase-like protein